MLGIENSRLRSVPEYRHQFARSLAGNLFLINSHRGRETHGENKRVVTQQYYKTDSNGLIVSPR